MRRMTALGAQRLDSPLPEISSRCASVSCLTLSHFRNYPSLRLEVAAEPVVLTGPNGAGKTNILEAISLLAPGRGLRGAKLDEIDCRFSKATWTIHSIAEGAGGRVEIGTGRAGEETARRTVKIDGKQIRGQAGLSQKLPLLWITPQMDGIFLESDTVRRKFLDRLAYGIEPEHAAHVAAYEQASRERMKLLEDSVTDDAWLSALEQEMAFRALHMARTRRDAVLGLNTAMQALNPSFPQGILATHGIVEAWLQDADGEEIILRGTHKLKAARLRDAAAGRLSEGLHRTVLQAEFITPGSRERKNATQCSTGEQKALLLSVMLAGCRAIQDHIGILPVLLLDEVVAHLDEARRNALFEVISDLGIQAWLTGTDERVFRPFRHKAQSFSITQGTIIPC
jgi:DNA replication and repair protein RecF